MARSPAEIQADIAVTRRQIETRLDALEHRLTRRGWTVPLVLGSAFAAGLLLARIPILRVLGVATGLLRAGAAVAGTVAALNSAIDSVDRLRSEPARRRAA